MENEKLERVSWLVAAIFINSEVVKKEKHF